ncbi:MAG: GNAT family N-acetyltransferase [Oligoflexales bacterium]
MITPAKPTPYRKILKKSDRLCVRPYNLSDYTGCQDARENRLSKINKFDDEIDITQFHSREDFKKMIDAQRERGKLETHFAFGVFDVFTGFHLGGVELFVLNKQLRWANLGYSIHNQYWGRGYATEACGLALQIAFIDLNLHRVEAATRPENKAAIQVAQKAGLVHEGIRKKFFAAQGGIDMVVFGANAIDYLS